MTNQTLAAAFRNNKIYTSILVLCGLLYVLFRLWHLTDSCLWFDEIFSVHAAEMTWPNLISFAAKDLIHPPLFYILLKLWIFIGGESLFWLRFLPVLFSIIALIPFYLLCFHLKLQKLTIAIAFILFAVNGALIKYAQEVRMYSLLLCFSLFSIWLFFRLMESEKGLFAITLINILLVYAHYFGWLVILSEVVTIVVLKRSEIKRISLSFAICLLSFSPWIYAVWQAAQTNADVSQNLGWASKPTLTVILQFIFDLFEPFYFQASSIDYSSNYLISVPILLILAAASALYFVFWKSEDAADKRNFGVLLVFVLTPCIAAFVFSWLLPYSIWGTRHLIVVFAPFLILTAAALDKIRLPVAKIGLILALGVLVVFSFIFETQRETQQFIWCGWEALAQDLDKKQPQTVYVFEDLVAYHFWFAVRESDKIQIVRVKDVPEMIEDKAYFLPRGFEAVQTVDVEQMTGDRFWVAFRDMKFDERHPPLNVLKEKGYHIGEPQSFDANGLKAYLVEVHK